MLMVLRLALAVAKVKTFGVCIAKVLKIPRVCKAYPVDLML